MAIAAAGRAAAAGAAVPRRARRRLAWDHQLRLRLVWLTLFFLALGEALCRPSFIPAEI